MLPGIELKFDMRHSSNFHSFAALLATKPVPAPSLPNQPLVFLCDSFKWIAESVWA